MSFIQIGLTIVWSNTSTTQPGIFICCSASCFFLSTNPSVAKFVNSYINRIKKEIVEEEKFTKRKSIKRSYIEISKTDRNILCGEEIDNKVGGVVIQFYISNNDNMSVGDKISLHSALKSVNSTVVPKELEPYRMNDGRIDGIFSMISCNARMIKSEFLAGQIGKILYDFSKQWAKDLLKELEYKKRCRIIFLHLFLTLDIRFSQIRFQI